MKSVYMAQRRDGSGYRKVSPSERDRMREAGIIRMAGVDGDEDADTVTYWYDRRAEQ